MFAGTDETSDSDEFVLARVDDHPTPGRLGAEQRLIGNVLHACTLDLESGELKLEDDDEFRLQVTSSETCIDNGSESGSQDGSSFAGDVVLSGGTLTLSPDSDFELNGYEFELDGGFLAGSGIVVRITRTTDPYEGSFLLTFRPRE